MELAVQLQLTNRCNLACTYCCTDSGEARIEEIDFAGWKRIVDQSIEYAGPGLRFGVLGGEPLFAPFALDLFDYILNRGGVLKVFTNGVPLATPAIAARLAALIGRGVELRVSLAGPARTSCDALSGGERFEPAVTGLRALGAYGARAVVDLMLIPSQVDDIVANLRPLRRRLPSQTRVCLGLLYCGGRELGQHLFGSRTELEIALDRIAFEAGELVPGPEPASVTARREACRCAYGNLLNVRSDGLLFSCFKMIEEPLGDLRKEPLARVWERARSNPRTASNLPRCADCLLATLCGGGCRSENLVYTGNADTPICGPWRVRVLSQLLAEDRADALDWPAAHLLNEARRRGIDTPEFGP
jgi:radical SAM protein with 4Fe4S-binding SPASM domain